MSANTRLLAIIVGAVVLIAAVAGVAFYLQRGQETGAPGPLATPGRWPASERTAFIDSCVKSCRTSPGVTAERYPLTAWTAQFERMRQDLDTALKLEEGLAVASRRLLGFGVGLLDVDDDGRLDLASANGHVNDLRPNYP